MFFQNLFDQEFRGTLMSADRQYSQNFNMKANVNRSDLMMAWNPEPYDLSTNTSLTINYAMDFASPNFASLTINVQGTTPAATLAYEVVQALNADQVFAALFAANVATIHGRNTVMIKCRRPKTAIKTFISNRSAENAFRFNLKAVVSELPSYFARHTMANAASYPDLSTGILLQLYTTNADDQAVITAAGLDYTTVQPDWKLLLGRSDAFHFRKKTYAGTNLASTIFYPAGAKVGDLAKKIEYTYDGSNNVLTECEIPYVLQSGDLVTPA